MFFNINKNKTSLKRLLYTQKLAIVQPTKDIK